jgi:DNA-directed RNA polymerase subunit A'
MASVQEEPYKIVDGIKFGVLSPSAIRRVSVVEVQMADTYDVDGLPINSGLMDGRFGTLEPRQRCRTCGNTAARCTGHFGHIELAAPVIHISFIKLIYKLLRVTCRACGRLLLDENQISEYEGQIERERRMLGTPSEELFKEIENKAKRPSICPHCQPIQNHLHQAHELSGTLE